MHWTVITLNTTAVVSTAAYTIIATYNATYNDDVTLQIHFHNSVICQYAWTFIYLLPNLNVFHNYKPINEAKK